MPSGIPWVVHVSADTSGVSEALDKIRERVLDLDFILNYTRELGEPEWEVFV